MMLSHSFHFVSEQTVCIKLGSYSAQRASAVKNVALKANLSALKANYCHKNTK